MLNERAPPTASRTTPPTAWTSEIAFDDPSPFEEGSRPWELLARPLRGGPFRHEKRIVVTPAITVYAEIFGSKTHVQGLSPPGVLTLVVPVRIGSSTRYWPKPRRAPGFPMMLPGCIDAMLDGGQVQIMVLVELERLEAHLSPQAWEHVQVCARQRLLPATRVQLDAIAHWLFGLLRDLRVAPELLDSAESLKVLEESLLDRVAGVLTPPGLPTPKLPTPRRLQVVHTALEWLHATHCADATVSGLCAATGVGLRSLQVAFRETLGLTPQQYTRKLRLHEARRCLFADDRAHTSVADVARLHGFQHLGRFAAAYRKLFGERPLDTLRRSRSVGPSPLPLRP